MLEKLYCLFCQAGIDCVSSSNNDGTNEDLTKLFVNLCVMLEIEFAEKFRDWDFKEVPFPFCGACRNEIARLMKFRDEIGLIAKQIQKIIIKLFTLTILSEERVGKELIGLKEPKTDNKYGYFRRAIIKRYCPRVLLEDFKADANQTVAIAVDAAEKLVDSNEASDREVYWDIVDTFHAREEEIDSYECASPEVSLEVDVEPEPSPKCPQGKLVSDVNISVNKNCGPSLVDALDESNNEASNSAKSSHTMGPPVSTISKSGSKGDDRSSTEKESSPAKANTLLQNSGKHRGTPAKFPPGNIHLVEGDTYSYHKVQFTADKGVAKCLECDYQTDANSTISRDKKIKVHIWETHVVWAREGQTQLVDEAKKIYIFRGFQFQEVGGSHLCLTCGNSFKIMPYKKGQSQFRYVRNHICLIHMETKASLCEICGDGKVVKNLPDHMKRKHPKESSESICNICGKVFKNRKYLYSHMNSHKDAAENKFQCERCGRKFRKKQHLQCHTLTHTGEKPFVCEKCGKGFAQRSFLQMHLPTHEKVRPFPCNQCEWSFGAKQLLVRHVKQVHEGEKRPAKKSQKKINANTQPEESVTKLSAKKLSLQLKCPKKDSVPIKDKESVTKSSAKKPRLKLKFPKKRSIPILDSIIIGL